jgi:Flp pilus assembly secretin CpaC
LLSKNALANTPVEKLSLVQGNSEVVSLKNDIGTLLVGDESVADVFMLSADSFYIFAKNLVQPTCRF